MKSLEDRKREILRNPPKKLMGKGLKSFDTIDYAKWISQLNALDKPRIDEGKLYGKLHDLVNIAEHLSGKEKIDKIREVAHTIAQELNK